MKLATVCIYYSLRKKQTYSELFWSVFFSIRAEYGEMRSICIVMPSLKLRIKVGIDTIYPPKDKFTEKSSWWNFNLYLTDGVQ